MIFERNGARRLTPENLIKIVGEFEASNPISVGFNWPIIESNWLYDSKYITRTWWERLFKKHEGKWQPFLRGYSVRIPDPMIYMINDHFNRKMFVGHPETIRRFKEQLDATTQKE